jgi:hypothetical protein
MGLQLKNADVAAKYEAAFDTDQTIHLPGVYSGPLSTVIPEAADMLVKQQSNLLLLKGSKTAAPPVPAKEKEK